MQRIRQKRDLLPSLRSLTLALENRWDENEFRRDCRPVNGYEPSNGHVLKEIRQFKEVWMDYYRESGAPTRCFIMFALSFKRLFSLDRELHEFLSRCEANQELLSEDGRRLPYMGSIFFEGYGSISRGLIE
jgi:hypothetical protein